MRCNGGAVSGVSSNEGEDVYVLHKPTVSQYGHKDKPTVNFSS